MPQKGSFLGWFFEALGPFCALVLPLVGLTLFFGVCFAVARSRRPSMIAAWLVLVPVPLMIGLQITLQRFVVTLATVSLSPAQPTFAESAGFVANSLVPLLVGMLETWPSFLVVAGGLLVRTIQAGKNGPK
jgi:hypothetical protein